VVGNSEKSRPQGAQQAIALQTGGVIDPDRHYAITFGASFAK